MRFTDVLAIALGQIRANKLRSFFTLLGIIVSVAFLVAVVAIIQGMNAYVRENIAGAVVGAAGFGASVGLAAGAGGVVGVGALGAAHAVSKRARTTRPRVTRIEKPDTVVLP